MCYVNYTSKTFTMQNTNIPEQWRLVKVTWMQTSPERYCLYIRLCRMGQCRTSCADPMPECFRMQDQILWKQPAHCTPGRWWKALLFLRASAAFQTTIQPCRRENGTESTLTDPIGKEPACVPEDSETRAQETAVFYAVYEPGTTV